MAPILPDPGSRAPPALPDHLLEEIFARISSPADLVRASAACASFRRLVAGPSFLRRGWIGWEPRDARDGRVLLVLYAPERAVVLPRLAVCDPLTWGYQLLPPVPDSLVPSALIRGQALWDQLDDNFFATFLPSGDYEEAQFRVLVWTHCQEMPVVYSSASGCWTFGNCINWDALGLIAEPKGIVSLLSGLGYAYGCFYWSVLYSNKLIKLDIRRLEFSTVDLPPECKIRNLTVVDAEEGRIGMLSICISTHTT